MNAGSLFSNGKRGLLTIIIAASTLTTYHAAVADTLYDSLPTCTSKGQTLEVNNDQVINWKSSTPNQYHSRAHIQGTLINIYPDKTGHHHLEVKIGATDEATIEVIYNEDFGRMPELALNQTIEACGDYITSNAPTGRYQASPDGAILHWVHFSPSPRHESGYVAVDGVPYGQDGSNQTGKNRKH